MAPVYDDFTAHYDYELWLSNLLPMLRRHGLRGHRLLDVGCGTGKSFLPMIDRGWDVTACDVSSSMLDLAQAKTNEARLVVADMRELPTFGEFDLIWSVDDAINYLLSTEELESALRGMRANLATDGLLTFDVNTLHAYRSFFSEIHSVDHGGHQLVWRGQASASTPPGSISEALLEDESGAGMETHVHRQRHFPESEVLELLEAAGLECLDVFGHGADAVLKQPAEELIHDKAVYIARAA